MPDMTDRSIAEPTGRTGSTFTSTSRRLYAAAAIRPGEGRCVGLFFMHAFLLLIAYYVLKTLREPLLLTEGSAELRSYASATTALVLMALVPLYGFAFRRIARCRLGGIITCFFIANLAIFYSLGQAGLDIGFAYYVWLGIFGVGMLAQFWAHAAHRFGVEGGQRLFPPIMSGAVAGGLVGPPLAKTLFAAVGPFHLMLLAMLLLALTLPLARRANDAPSAVGCPPPSGSETLPEPEIGRGDAGPFGGFALIRNDRYLALMALLVVLLNCVNSIGEYVLAETVVRHAELQLAGSGTGKAESIASFYAGFYFLVNALALALQLAVVGRVFRRLGVGGAVAVLPIVALAGYGLVMLIPVFAIVAAVKVAENSVNYSIMNTARHALYLPLSTRAKYEGKAAIDMFFWRLGDLLQAGIIFAGLNWLDLDFRAFAAVNVALASVWLAVALRVGRDYAGRVSTGAARTQERPRRFTRRLAVSAAASAAAALALGANTAHGDVAVASARLFEERAPLEIELVLDMKAFCRDPRRRGCSDTPATLIVPAEGGMKRLDVHVRSRGRWRTETGNCALPALFVVFGPDTGGTAFEGQHSLALTTHCRKRHGYQQYVLKEYLAYRLYNALTDKSLRVRLARITYTDHAGRRKPIERYAFFTEHFESLAARYEARVSETERFDAAGMDPHEAATLELFQFMIGNTDWSMIFGHNVVHLRDERGRASAVPYDFDFSGLVDAEYAGPPPQLPIRRVTQRLFRGLCRNGFDWPTLFRQFEGARHRLEDLARELPPLDDRYADDALRYLESFFEILASPRRRNDEIVAACRPSGS